jgi:hypothetical protein
MSNNERMEFWINRLEKIQNSIVNVLENKDITEEEKQSKIKEYSFHMVEATFVIEGYESLLYKKVSGF